MTPNVRSALAWLRTNGFMCSAECSCRKAMKMQYVDGIQNRKLVAEWLAKNATITLACEPETEQIEGNASAVDPETDRETCEWIERQLARGNEWAWCTVTVTVTYCDFSARDSLGCCSYESEQAFREGGYFDDMVRVCCTDLVAQLCDARETLHRAFEIATLGR